jgi:hypothetical protein
VHERHWIDAISHPAERRSERAPPADRAPRLPNCRLRPKVTGMFVCQFEGIAWMRNHHEPPSRRPAFTV